MTALKPIENRRVRGVASEVYPTNKTCAHPHCTEPATNVHHTFPRSQIKSTSYFVAIEDDDKEETILPHAVGLCGTGTTGHHGDVEEHRAWIKLEVDTYIWFDRAFPPHGETKHDKLQDIDWTEVGALNPQPGSRDGKTKKRKPTAVTTDAKRATKTYTIKVPKGEENIIPELMEQAQERFQEKLEADQLPLPYVTTVAALKDMIES